MNFYAYKTLDGTEPMGTEGKLIFSLKTINGAINRCKRILGDKWILQGYTNFYDPTSFYHIHSVGLTAEDWQRKRDGEEK